MEDHTDKTLEKEATAPTRDKKIRRRRALVPVALVFVAIGWIIMVLSWQISMACTVIGLILSIIGVRIPAGPRRNIAITSIIASSVLLLVFIIIFAALHLI